MIEARDYQDAIAVKRFKQPWTPGKRVKKGCPKCEATCSVCGWSMMTVRDLGCGKLTKECRVGERLRKRHLEGEVCDLCDGSGFVTVECRIVKEEA